MFSHHPFGNDPEEITIGLTEKDDFPIRVGDHHPIMDIIKDRFVELDLFLELIEIVLCHRLLFSKIEITLS
jgi:hypothetical protein